MAEPMVSVVACDVAVIVCTAVSLIALAVRAAIDSVVKSRRRVRPDTKARRECRALQLPPAYRERLAKFGEDCW
jgi:hypothetical protein